MTPRWAYKYRHNGIIRSCLVIAGLIIIVSLSISVFEWVHNYNAVHFAEAQTSAANHGHPSGAPSTVKPSDAVFNSYTVAPSQPRYLFINSIGVRAMIKPLGVTTSGAIDTPSNVYDVGWYNKSSLPGMPGAAVIDGHVTGWNADGVFFNLDKLEAGDTITVELGSGSLLTYHVSKSVLYDTSNFDMSALLSSVSPNKPGLNLITCAGELIPSTGHYDKRLVVFAIEN